MELETTDIPDDFPVRPLEDDFEKDNAKDLVQCGDCLLWWDDGVSTQYTPAPSARCPFEAFHEHEDEGGDFELHISLENSAFSDGTEREEIARILRKVATQVEQGPEESAHIFDGNGNNVGSWAITRTS